MEGCGLRASEVTRTRWSDVDLTRGRLRVLRKGGNKQTLPILPDVLAELQACYREIQPGQDWHLFTVRERGFSLDTHRLETVRDPLRPAERNSLWYLLRRTCERAGIRRLSAHQLRHGFAVRLRRAGYPVDVIQFLLGHERLETTRRYLDDLRIDDVEREIMSRQAAPAPDATLKRGSVGSGPAGPGPKRTGPEGGRDDR
jgi:integrase/recombinase XerC